MNEETSVPVSPLTLTADEYRNLLMARIELSLRDNGVPVDEPLRTAIRSALPAAGTMIARPAAQTLASPRISPPASARTIREARQIVETVGNIEDNRARAYIPTPLAKEVPNAKAVATKTLNLIIRKGVCTLGDLTKGIKKPKRAIYTALWQLHKDGLIEKMPIAELARLAERDGH